jgi:CheY-like chemotaxis protein
METTAPKPSRWLVVDDDEQILTPAARMLRHLGSAEVVACSDSSRAIDAFLADPDSFELLVTDLEMPGLDGVELARHLRLLSPRLRVLLVTGSPRSDEELCDPDVHGLLRKPFSREDLSEEVSRLLGTDQVTADDSARSSEAA